jgi:hypothetical protein
LSGEGFHRVRASEAGIITDPQPAVLLPREVWQKVIFRIDIVPKRTRTEKGVYETAVRELT